jgi:hypothetical protein
MADLFLNQITLTKAQLAPQRISFAQGRRYSDAMSVWLTERGFDEIGEPTRCEAVRVVEDLAISEWRDTLPEHERVRLNHPCSVLHAYGLVQRAKRESPSRRSPAKTLALAAERLRRHFPLASEDARLQAAADVLELAGLKLPDRLNRAIGGRVPNTGRRGSARINDRPSNFLRPILVVATWLCGALTQGLVATATSRCFVAVFLKRNGAIQ